MKLEGKNVLVTGGAGFVGGHLVEELITLNANVIVVDITLKDNSYFVINNLHKKAKYVRLDLCDYTGLSKFISKYKIDFIFHLAAQALVENAFVAPKHTLENNIVSTINILETVRVNPTIQGLIVASSDKCYGKLHKDKYVETDPLSGDHPYDTSKSATDLISSTYFSTYKIPVTITRFGNIYGEGDNNFSRIIPGIMTSLVTKKPLELRSNGSYIRDYLYVKDVVAGYILLAHHINEAQGQAYNFGSKDTLSVFDVIHTIEEVLAQKIPYRILNTTSNEIPYQSLDFTKIKSQFGWEQKMTIKKVAKQLCIWYKKNL